MRLSGFQDRCLNHSATHLMRRANSRAMHRALRWGRRSTCTAVSGEWACTLMPTSMALRPGKPRGGDLGYAAQLELSLIYEDALLPWCTEMNIAPAGLTMLGTIREGRGSVGGEYLSDEQDGFLIARNNDIDSVLT